MITDSMKHRSRMKMILKYETEDHLNKIRPGKFIFFNQTLFLALTKMPLQRIVCLEYLSRRDAQEASF